MKNRKGTIKAKITKTHFKDRKNGNRKLKQLMKTKFKAYKRKKRVRQYNSDEDGEEVIPGDPEECMEQKTMVTNDNEDISETRGSRNGPSSEAKDAEEEGDSNDDDDDDDDETGGKRSKGNEGWADVMTKILTRRVDSKRPAILAKGRTDQEIARKKEIEKSKAQGFEIDGSEANPVAKDGAKTSYEREKSVKQMKRELRAKLIEKKTWENLGRVKPDVLNREKERALQRIATRGVVQLFNAVRDRQKTVAVKMNEVGGSEIKRERVMKSMTKGDFLDVLKQKAKSIPLKDAVKLEKKEATKADTGTKPTWNVFSEKFMLGAKMKDWDKDSDSNSDIWENDETLIKNENDNSPSSSDEG